MPEWVGDQTDMYLRLGRARYRVTHNVYGEVRVYDAQTNLRAPLSVVGMLLSYIRGAGSRICRNFGLPDCGPLFDGDGREPTANTPYPEPEAPPETGAFTESTEELLSRLTSGVEAADHGRTPGEVMMEMV